jgi:hypothetical protein
MLLGRPLIRTTRGVLKHSVHADLWLCGVQPDSEPLILGRDGPRAISDNRTNTNRFR